MGAALVSRICQGCDEIMHKVGARRRYCDVCRAVGIFSPGPGSVQHWAQIRFRYNLTLKQYKTIFDAQEGLCAICLEPETNRKSLSVDHDRSCCPGNGSCGSCVRGLLCNRCNSSIGKFNDNPELLDRASTYLRRQTQ